MANLKATSLLVIRFTATPNDLAIAVTEGPARSTGWLDLGTVIQAIVVSRSLEVTDRLVGDVEGVSKRLDRLKGKVIDVAYRQKRPAYQE